MENTNKAKNGTVVDYVTKEDVKAALEDVLTKTEILMLAEIKGNASVEDGYTGDEKSPGKWYLGTYRSMADKLCVSTSVSYNSLEHLKKLGFVKKTIVLYRGEDWDALRVNDVLLEACLNERIHPETKKYWKHYIQNDNWIKVDYKLFCLGYEELETRSSKNSKGWGAKGEKNEKTNKEK